MTRLMTHGTGTRPMVAPIILILAALLTIPGSAARQTRRFMPFLAPNAVVNESTESMSLVSEKRQPVIVVEETAGGPRADFENKQIIKSAELLVTYIEKISGITLKQVNAADATPAAPRIFVHETGPPGKLFPDLRTADAHGFVVATRGNDLHIVGGSGVGTLYGAWFFLQNYCGLRIVMPGELGKVYPRADRIEIPRNLYVFNDSPEFLLRIHSLNNGFDGSAWLADFGASQRFDYHHNLWRIYDPEKFGENHPEFFPMRNGKRYIPRASVRSGWQPTLSEPATIRRASEYADEAFTEFPDKKSISLTMNDGGGWSDIDTEKAKLQGRTLAEVYYDFVNAVAQEVKKKWPDKFVTILCYGEVSIHPPKVPLEDNVMLFIFSYSGNPGEVLDQWQGKVKHLGCYQWIYGHSYVTPNHWPHAIQDYVQLIRRHGGNAFKTEFYAAYADSGAKLWVLSNLLWNTQADVDALLMDYFEHMYGREAAPAMARYFARWEQVYERRRTPEKFNLVIFPGGETQFRHITDADLAVCQEALREASGSVVGEANRQRLDMTTRLFEQSRRFYTTYKSLETLKGYSEDIPSLGDAEERLNIAASFLEAEGAIYDWRYAKIEPAAMYCSVMGKSSPARPWGPNYLSTDPRLLYVYADAKWVKVADAAINRIVQYITDARRGSATPEQVADYWISQAKRRPVLAAYAESERLKLLHPNAPLQNLLGNGSFETVGDPNSPEAQAFLKAMRSYDIMWNDNDHCTVSGVACEGWNVFENRCPLPPTVTLDRATAHEGATSLRIQSVGQFGGVLAHTALPDPRSRYRLSFWCKAQGGARIRYGLMLYKIRHLPYFELYGPEAEEWTKVEIDFPCHWGLKPDETGDISVWLGIGSGNSDEAAVWFDAVRLVRLSPEGRAN